ncbi:twin-arginine translocase TatA/TatE family subunit [Candidatus Korarchaeum cryptofilum]|uniref:Sec-independent protein translocase protein TatA n=1 Tax=Korarchaeum cryptofilum (strain OPF8) TaxID=374847 RepID=B1L5Z3_KORCO|nr:twin-arginine translocase TatA/TatE family subunit [Candidatus Korarchaeum cryptofilum]ACB07872.1 Sec-independent protein secretion pathway component [Candidatus Korarchaeum cryptofilum OPF8]
MIAPATVKLMQFGGLGIWEILLLVLIALILFGPRKLPELARAMGEAVREFRKAASSTEESQKSSSQSERTEGKSSIRELAISLGIDVSGKTDEEILEEIKSRIRSNSS